MSARDTRLAVLGASTLFVLLQWQEVTRRARVAANWARVRATLIPALILAYWVREKQINPYARTGGGWWEPDINPPDRSYPNTWLQWQYRFDD